MSEIWYEGEVKYVRLETFYPEDVVPQDNVDESTESDEERYCFCREPGWLGGNFIECSNRLCKISWFHLDCVKLNKAPTKDWSCPRCRKQDHWCICGRKGMAELIILIVSIHLYSPLSTEFCLKGCCEVDLFLKIVIVSRFV